MCIRDRARDSGQYLVVARGQNVNAANLGFLVQPLGAKLDRLFDAPVSYTHLGAGALSVPIRAPSWDGVRASVSRPSVRIVSALSYFGLWDEKRSSCASEFKLFRRAAMRLSYVFVG